MAKKLLILPLIIISILIVYFVNTNLSKKAQYSIESTIEGFKLTLYNNMDEEVFSENYPKEPWVNEIEDDILEVGISTGSPSRYIFFFDKKTSEISDMYFNPIFFGENYIAFMDKNILVLTDYFMRGLLYLEIERDFSKSADPISSVISIEMIEDNTISISYFEGVSFNEKTETVIIPKSN